MHSFSRHYHSGRAESFIARSENWRWRRTLFVLVTESEGRFAVRGKKKHRGQFRVTREDAFQLWKRTRGSLCLVPHHYEVTLLWKGEALMKLSHFETKRLFLRINSSERPIRIMP